MPLVQDASPLAAALTSAAGAASSAAVVLALGARPWNGREQPSRAWSAPLAVAAGSAVGTWLARGRPSFPPASAVHWLFYAALLGGALGVLEALGPRVRTLRALAAVLLPVLVLQFQRTQHWARIEGILWTASLALLVFAAWSALAGLEERGAGGAALTLGLAFATALGAGCYVLGGGVVLAQQAGALALGLGLCALLGLWRRAPALGPGGVAPYVLLHYGFLWIARWVNELSTSSFVLLTLVPFAALAPALAPALRPRVRIVLALGAPTLLGAVALALDLASADTSAYG